MPVDVFPQSGMEQTCLRKQWQLLRNHILKVTLVYYRRITSHKI